jgi:hypothetical protein
MGKYLLVVPSSAITGRNAEYDDWYENTHIAEFLALPGVVSLRRFEAMPNSPSPVPGEYLALIEIETDDPRSIFAAMGQRAQAGTMSPPSPALDMSSVSFWLYGPR